MDERIRLTPALAVLGFALSCAAAAERLSPPRQDVVIPGAGVGPIPDGPQGMCGTPGVPLDVAFVVPALPGYRLADLDVEIGINHDATGDVTARLLDPAGARTHVLFGRVGATDYFDCGSYSQLGGSDQISTYTFSDAATNPPYGGFWQAAAAANPNRVVAPGTYRTTDIGGAGAVDPMPPTSLKAAFGAMQSAEFAGTWTLRFVDSGIGLTGRVRSATLRLHLEIADLVFADGFE